MVPYSPKPLTQRQICVYKLDVMTGMILTLHCFLSNYPTEGAAKYIQHALQLKSFKVTLGYPWTLYIEAKSPKAIRTFPPLKPLLCCVTNHSCSNTRCCTTITSWSFCFCILGSHEVGHIPKWHQLCIVLGWGPSWHCGCSSGTSLW